MHKKSSLLPILFGLITILFVACDKDFTELGTDIIGDNHFGFEKYTGATVKGYNQKLGPIASNNLAINPLGIYDNPVFGQTTANFVTQLELSSFDPTFNNTTPGDYSSEAGHGPTALDSVILEVPYFKTVVSTQTVNDTVRNTYRLDSIYGAKPYDQTAATVGSKFKLSVYQSNYFLRDLDPGTSLAQTQAFYTDENSTISSNASSVLLNDAPQIDDPQTGTHNTDGHERDNFYFDKREHKTRKVADDGTKTFPRSAPSMRLHLNKTVFANAILTAPDGALDNNSTFKNYFRGLYFKVENGSPGNMAMLNFKGGKVTLYYNEDKKKTDAQGVVTYERIRSSYVLNMNGNTISLLENQDNPTYLAAATSTNEADKLYLKGGQGSIAMIDLFGADTYRYTVLKAEINGNMVPVDLQGNQIPTDLNGNPTSGHYLFYKKEMIPNGVGDELDDLRYPLIDESVGQIYHSTKNRWMINEANLTFYIDKPAMSDAAAVEPNRIYLYDLTHSKALFDFTYDGSSSTVPKFNKGVFGGILFDDGGRVFKQRNTDGDFVKKGSFYKVRITAHIRNLIKNDSTNVRLGLAVTETIANVGFSKLRTANSNTNRAPTASVMNPLGTVLHGSNPSVPEEQRLKLEIYYTKPD